jgi:hypothetical protein
LAERVGQWAAEQTQRHGLALVAGDHAVHGACTSLRTGLARLSAGMTTHRQVAQGEQGLAWLAQAQGAKGRYRPPLAVGRDGIFGPLGQQGWQAGATATVAVFARRGKRLGTG